MSYVLYLVPTRSNDSNHNAQDTFFSKAPIEKDKPPAPPKVSDEPVEQTGGSAAKEVSQPQAPEPTDPPDTGESAGKTASVAPEKNYKAVDTEPHHASSEVLSSVTPGATLDSRDTRSGDGNSTGITGTDVATGGQTATQETSEVGTTDTKEEDHPTEHNKAGLSGVPHDTSTPSAPDTGVPEATEDAGLGASKGEGKPKISQKIKEKLHIGKKDK